MARTIKPASRKTSLFTSKTSLFASKTVGSSFPSIAGDPTFALPFWNWDHPDGMQIPDMYTGKSSALYDVLRSTTHQPPATVDLHCDVRKAPQPREKQVKENLSVMHKNMVSGAKFPLRFFGSPYRLGTKGCTCAGTIEQHRHNSVHNWTGHE
ncbi:hypothetical protein L484_000892 [Morus notabilis]|uniref:Polyphenol oxidase n=1 Tax=Morus notabilis TaxID=981085 RepID=W9QWB5_9ROSA|nr:hypothetical protein L484_000892 [Morus notabilis]